MERRREKLLGAVSGLRPVGVQVIHGRNSFTAKAKSAQSNFECNIITCLERAFVGFQVLMPYIKKK